jgi:DNA-binding CsgD family transcriptional regulator
MSLWRDLFSRLGLLPSSNHHFYKLDETLYTTLKELAEHEQRPVDEIASEFVVNGLNQWLSQDDLSLLWQSLSPREQDVAALTCLGYTNQQMAVRLGISAETVKTHLHNAQVKFNVRGRSGMRILLANWDFSKWDH